MIPNPVDGLSPKTFLGIFSVKDDPVLRIFAYVLLVGERSSSSWCWVSSSEGMERGEHPDWKEEGNLLGEGDGERGAVEVEGDKGPSWFNMVSDWHRSSGLSGVETGSLIRLYPNPEGCISSEADFTVAAAYKQGWEK